jgi:hypothetical protein
MATTTTSTSTTCTTTAAPLDKGTAAAIAGGTLGVDNSGTMWQFQKICQAIDSEPSYTTKTQLVRSFVDAFKYVRPNQCMASNHSHTTTHRSVDTLTLVAEEMYTCFAS